MVDLSKDPNYDSLVEALLEKTLARKLDWQVTAEDDCFLAAVKGKRSFEIKAKPILQLESILDRTTQDILLPGSRMRELEIMLTVRDETGDKLFDFQQRGRDTAAFQLYEAARRIASRIDERIDESLELLNSL